MWFDNCPALYYYHVKWSGEFARLFLSSSDVQRSQREPRIWLPVFTMQPCFSDWIRRPHGVLHLQPRLRHLLLGGVLLPAVHHHPAGLRSHLHLPQDEAEEDRLQPGQPESAAGLSSAVGGERLWFNCPINTDLSPRLNGKAFLRASTVLSSTAPLTKSKLLYLNFKKPSIFPLPDENNTDLTCFHSTVLVLVLSTNTLAGAAINHSRISSPGHQTRVLPLQETACLSAAAHSLRPHGAAVYRPTLTHQQSSSYNPRKLRGLFKMIVCWSESQPFICHCETSSGHENTHTHAHTHGGGGQAQSSYVFIFSS